MSEHEPRVLRYRPQVRWVGAVLKWVGIFHLAVALLLVIEIFLLHSFDAPGAIFLQALNLFFFGLWSVAVYWWILRPLMFVQIRIFADRIDVQRGSKQEQILFSEIQSVVSSFIFNIFVVVMKNGKRYRFGYVLERSEYIIEGIVKNRPEIMHQSDYQKLRSLLIQKDHFGAFYQSLFFGENGVRLGFAVLVVPVLFGLAVFFIQMRDIVVYSYWAYAGWLLYIGFTGSLLFQLMTLSCVALKNAITLKQRLKAHPDDKRRDIAAERWWVHTAVLLQVAFVIIGFCLVVRYNLNLVEQENVLGDYPNFKIASHETFWVDKRYNCVECAYSLKKGDLIVLTSQEAPVGVVALPGESVAINLIDDNKSIIIGQELVIPPKKIAVQIWEKGRTATHILRDISFVRGLLTRSFPSRKRPLPSVIEPSVTFVPLHHILLSGCEPAILAHGKSSTQQFVNAGELLFKAKNYEGALVSFHAAIDVLLKDTKACPALVSAITETLRSAAKFNRQVDQAWVIRSAVDAVFKAISAYVITVG